eukprot:5056885-Alexandrium_andersonii.AAC.1
MGIPTRAVSGNGIAILPCRISDFVPVPEWKSVYAHPELDLFLVVYVDDFKMAGKPENAQKGWKLTQSRLDLDPPTDIGRFLGCEHEIVEKVYNGRVARCT